MTKKFLCLMTAVLILLTAIALPAAAKEKEAPAGLDICFLATADVDDGSFVQQCHEGVLQFLEMHPDSKVTDVVENDFDKLPERLEELVKKHDVFVLPGYVFTEIGETVLANPDVTFIVIDSGVTDTKGNPVSADNLYTMGFREEEGGFFAGVAAALETKSNQVAVVNGYPHLSNIDYQYGFAAGVNYANAHYDTKVKCVELPAYAGTDEDGKKIGGNYIGNYIDREKGKTIGKALIDAGVDILFVAAGDGGNGVFEAALEAEGVRLIGESRDQYDDGQKGSENRMLTSTKKDIARNVCRQLTDVYYGFFVGQDAVLDAGTDSTGYFCEEGRHGLSDDTLEKLEECYQLVKEGVIMPPAAINGHTPDKFPGL